MGDLENEIRELRERTALTRYQFLKAELQTCCTALEMAQYELSIGDVVVVGREVAAVEEGIRTLERFLPEATAEQREEVGTRVAELKTILDSVKTGLHTQSR
jgi:phage terminase Nu1 subunit (DNA packaging protein)